MSSCPFLTRLPSSFVKNYGTVLAKQYLEHCPFLGTHLDLVQQQPKRNIGTQSTRENLQCPFLKDAKKEGLIKSINLHDLGNGKVLFISSGVAGRTRSGQISELNSMKRLR